MAIISTSEFTAASETIFLTGSLAVSTSGFHISEEGCHRGPASRMMDEATRIAGL
jgi:hypothetical protein